MAPATYIGIDVAYRNFGLYAARGETMLSHLKAYNIDLMAGIRVYTLAALKRRLQTWYEQEKEELDLDNAVIYIERQMRQRLNNVVTALHTILPHATIVGPQSVKKIFGIGTGNYLSNKHASALLASPLFPDGTAFVMVHNIADAYFLLHTGLCLSKLPQRGSISFQCTSMTKEQLSNPPCMTLRKKRKQRQHGSVGGQS